MRFGREVAAARRVSGLFTALVVDADVEGPVPWLATAYVAGPSLSEAVTGCGPMSVQATLALTAGLAEGLSAIHAAGVVHCDLKPSNVLLSQDGPRVIDFGISRAAEMVSVTGVGLVVGSPGFMSPEQATGGEIGPPSDIFSLGAVLTFAATGGGLSVRGRGPSWPTASSTARRAWTGCPASCARWPSAAWPRIPASGRRPTRCWPKRVPHGLRPAGPWVRSPSTSLRIRPSPPPRVKPARPTGSGRAAGGGGRSRGGCPGVCPIQPRPAAPGPEAHPACGPWRPAEVAC